MDKKKIKGIEKITGYEYEEYDKGKKVHTFVKNGWWEHWRLFIYDSGKMEIVYIEEHDGITTTYNLTSDYQKAIKEILGSK